MIKSILRRSILTGTLAAALLLTPAAASETTPTTDTEVSTEAPAPETEAPAETEKPAPETEVFQPVAVKTAAGTWIPEAGKWKFKSSHNKTGFYKSGFYKIDRSWYYFNKRGYVEKGWIKVKKVKYYASVEPDSRGIYGALYTGWKTIDGKKYYFSPKKAAGKAGVMASGWQKIKKKIYYFGKDGVMRTGLKKIKKKYYYFSTLEGSLGQMKTGWKTIDGKKYYFRKKGKLGVIGSAYAGITARIGGKTYVFNTSGTVNTATLSESEFIRTVGALAREDMKHSGVLASVTVAQAILESGYGTSVLAVGANNLFGMKATLSGNTWGSAWDGKTYRKLTWEYLNGQNVQIYADFRAYGSYAESVADHSAYLTGAPLGNGALRYAGLKGCRNYRKAAQIIKNGGYATDPNYVSKLCALIQRYDLTQYDKKEK